MIKSLHRASYGLIRTSLPVQERKLFDSEDIIAGTERPGERPVTTIGFSTEGKNTPTDGGTTWTKPNNGMTCYSQRLEFLALRNPAARYVYLTFVGPKSNGSATESGGGGAGGVGGKGNGGRGGGGAEKVATTTV